MPSPRARRYSSAAYSRKCAAHTDAAPRPVAAMRKPSKENQVCFAIRSKEYITERIAVEAVLAVLKTGSTAGDVPELGLSVQRVGAKNLREPVYYIRMTRK